MEIWKSQYQQVDDKPSTLKESKRRANAQTYDQFSPALQTKL